MNPDFQHDEATVHGLKSALDRYGCCVVRNFVPLSKIDSIQRATEKVYQEMDQRMSSNTMSDSEFRHCYRYGIVRPFEVAIDLSDGMKMDEAMLGIVYSSMLKLLLIEHFGPEINLLVPSSHVRRIKPGTGVPFHQDSSVMKLHSTRILNCWFPLDKAGGDSPTLEVVPIGLKELLPMGDGTGDGLYSHLQISENTLDATNKLSQSWMPTMMPGDVLLLDSYTVHRTHQTAEMTTSRRDFELRFASRQSIESRTDIPQQRLEIAL